MCLALQGNSIASNRVAENALNRILDSSGLAKNFILFPCDEVTDAAIALTYKGERYIFYSAKFMNAVNSNLNDWANLFVLAHEVGHHVNGHTIDLQLFLDGEVSEETKYKRRQQELEADEWAGFVISKLGANYDSWQDVRKLISVISSSGDDTYDTHPNKQKRLVAAQTGYNKGKKYKQKSYSSTNYNTSTSKRITNNIYLPNTNFLDSPRSFWYKERRYQSYEIFASSNFKSAEVGLLANGGGLIKIVAYSSSYINGTLSIYLNNGKIIKCFDKGFRDKINYDRVSYYYLTKNEMQMLFNPKIGVDEIRYREGSNYKSIKSPFNIFNKHINQLRLKLGFVQNTSPKKSSDYQSRRTTSNNSTTKPRYTPPSWDYESKGPKRADYSSFDDYLQARKRWTQKREYKKSSEVINSANYKSHLNYKTLNKKYHSEHGLTLGVGYLEGVILSLEGYFGSWSLGFRSSFYDQGVTNLQGVIGIKLIDAIYLKTAVGNANNVNAYDYSYIDYTSYSAGVSFFKKGDKISFSPEVTYDFQKQSIGGILSISF